MDPEEEDYYCSSGGDEAEDSGVDVGFVCAADSPLDKNYKILNDDNIKELQENDIATVSSTLSVSRSIACALLCRNNWNPNSVFEDWFASGSEDKPSKPTAKSAKREPRTELCTICYNEITIQNLISAACGHQFCPDCWKTYISISINDGPGCLTLSCPESDCKAIVGLEMVESLASDNDQKKYYQFLRRSYVESNKSRKWCPGPGCDLAIEFEGGETYDVTCDCSFKFCWNCAEESHRPVDCNTVAKWIRKNSSESQNTTWIFVYTKPCPNCGRPIQKNNGCNHMRCPLPCGFSFCWACLRSLKEHTSCNKYEEKNETKMNRMMARNHMERYNHYLERWDSNDKSRKQALRDLSRARNDHVEILAALYNENRGKLQFVVEAWDQIIECRRVLKWTYAYGYYLYLPKSLTKSRKEDFFEYLQGEAEMALERLHHCAETELVNYINGDYSIKDFKNFRAKLVCLTSVTKTYFENLVKALENDLSEVESSKKKRRKAL